VGSGQGNEHPGSIKESKYFGSISKYQHINKDFDSWNLLLLAVPSSCLSAYGTHSGDLSVFEVVTEADRQKTCDLRSQHEEHEMKLVQLRKTSQQETHKLVSS
jgi:hypothetical protein